jgi:uncharacterized membrane protein
MPSSSNKTAMGNAFQRLHSFPKLIICLSIALLMYLLVQIEQVDVLTHAMIGWDTFSFCMIIINWITFSLTSSTQIREQSKVQDSSRTIVFFIILVATIASFLAVFLIILSRHQTNRAETVHLIIALTGMVFSWFLIHTIFTLRYAHIFYGDNEERPHTHAAGLKFPGDKNPDYFDFAYFAFVLGMTFQVSDVQITSNKLRRMAMWHGLLSFGYNTIMIALTINLIAGLGN